MKSLLKSIPKTVEIILEKSWIDSNLLLYDFVESEDARGRPVDEEALGGEEAVGIGDEEEPLGDNLAAREGGAAAVAAATASKLLIGFIRVDDDGTGGGGDA